MFATPEAKDFTEELKTKADELQELAKDAAKKGAEKTKQTAQAVHAHTQQPASGDGKITYDEFKKVEVRVGTITSVEKIEKSDKLLLLQVDLGESEPRQIVSGIAPYFDDPGSLVNRQAMFVANLAPRKIFGIESNGMIFAVSDENSFSILEPDTLMTPGTQAS